MVYGEKQTGKSLMISSALSQVVSLAFDVLEESKDSYVECRCFQIYVEQFIDLSNGKIINSPYEAQSLQSSTREGLMDQLRIIDARKQIKQLQNGLINSYSQSILIVEISVIDSNHNCSTVSLIDFFGIDKEFTQKIMDGKTTFSRKSIEYQRDTIHFDQNINQFNSARLIKDYNDNTLFSLRNLMNLMLERKVDPSSFETSICGYVFQQIILQN